MKKIYKKVNIILAEWDPLGIGTDISKDEYLGIIPLVIKNRKNKNNLTLVLEDFLINNLNISYDNKLEEHRVILEEIIIKILEIE
jgi:hypothetical protein